ncbi:hypothetical protein [Arachidicoccus sp.]
MEYILSKNGRSLKDVVQFIGRMGQEKYS